MLSYRSYVVNPTEGWVGKVFWNCTGVEQIGGSNLIAHKYRQGTSVEGLVASKTGLGLVASNTDGRSSK
jgi:hypothetical protein